MVILSMYSNACRMFIQSLHRKIVAMSAPRSLSVSVCLCRGRSHGTRARKGMAGAAGKPDALLDQLSLVSQVEAPSTCASEPDFVEIRARCHGS